MKDRIQTNLRGPAYGMVLLGKLPIREANCKPTSPLCNIFHENIIVTQMAK